MQCLHGTVEGVPAGKHLRPNASDDGNGRDHNQSGDQRVFEDFAAGFVFDEVSPINVHSESPLKVYDKTGIGLWQGLLKEVTVNNQMALTTDRVRWSE